MKIIDTAALKEKALQKPQTFYLLDVRELDEYEAGHLPGALFVPWHVVAEKMKGIDLATELIVYCRTGTRAKKAADILERLGYTSIALYREGWEGWNKN